MIQAYSRIVYDGMRSTGVMLTGVSDGMGGDEVNERKVVARALSPPAKRLKIKCIEFTVSGGIASLRWDSSDPIVIANLTGFGKFDYSPTLVDNTDSITGDILLSTVGFDTGSSYSIKIDFEKNRL